VPSGSATIPVKLPQDVPGRNSASPPGAVSPSGLSEPRPLLTWTHWREASRVILHGPHIRRSLLVALIVGSVLFAINHLDEVLRGRAAREVWVKGALTYLVPFCVSNVGLLIGTHRRAK
jgi:hypothetical protein